jgi:hypothetical protein
VTNEYVAIHNANKMLDAFVINCNEETCQEIRLGINSGGPEKEGNAGYDHS